MLCLDDIEKNKIIKDQGFSPLQILEKLNKEMKLLVDKKQKIIDSQKNLLFIMNKRIEAKKSNNERLRLEIEKLKTTCVKMARNLNASIKFDIDNSAFH
jgi:hypothetical protein